MKKILTLFALVLLSCMGAWAEEIRPTYVSSNSTKAGSPTTNEGPGLLVDATGHTTKWGEDFTNGTTTLWIIVRADNTILKGYTLVNGNDTNTYPGRRWASWTVAGSNSADENGSWTTIDTQTDATVNYNVQYASTTFSTSSNTQGYNYYKITLTKINGTGSNAGMQQMGDLKFDVEYTVQPVSFTYRYLYKGEEKLTQPVQAIPGQEYPNPLTVWNSAPFGITAATPAGNVSETDDNRTIDINLLENVPFETYSNYESVKMWQTLKMTTNSLYVKYEDGQDKIQLTGNTAIDINNVDAYSWAFIGNPFDGYQIVNKAAGEGYALYSKSCPHDGNTGGSTYPVVHSTSDIASGYTTTFFFGSATNNDKNDAAFSGHTPFLIGVADNDRTPARMEYMNSRQPSGSQTKYLAYWVDNHDGGSMFIVDPAPIKPALLVSGHKVAAKNIGSNAYAYVDGSANKFKNNANYQDENSELILFAVQGQEENGYYLYNHATQKLVGKLGGSNVELTVTDNPDNAGLYKFSAIDGTNYWSVHCENHTWTSDQDKGYWHINNGVKSGGVISWEVGSSSNTSSEWILVDEGEATDAEMEAIRALFPVNVTINYTAGSHTWSIEKRVAEGELTAADVAVDFYTNFNITTDDKTVSESNKTFEVTCDDNFPFTVGVATRVQSRGGGHQNQDFYNGVTYPQYGANGFDPNTNLWVFEHVANSADLFTVKNVATGKYLTFQSGTRQIGTLTETASNSGENTSRLRVRKSTYASAPEGAFCLQHPTVVACCYGPHINDTGYGDPVNNGLGGWAAGNEEAALSNDQNCLIAIAPDACPVVLSNPNPTKESGLDGKYVGTFSAVYNVQLPDGVVAYTAAIDGNTVNFTVLGSCVPANTGVLLYAESAQANINAQATPCANSAISSVNTDGNVFLPTTGAEIPEGSYILANVNNHVSFYLIGEERTVAKNKAYLTAPAGSNLSAFRFDFEEGTTGIEAIENNTNATVFDLQGRRVQNAKSGLYIVNGKKVIR